MCFSFDLLCSLSFKPFYDVSILHLLSLALTAEEMTSGDCWALDIIWSSLAVLWKGDRFRPVSHALNTASCLAFAIRSCDNRSINVGRL